MRYYHIRFPQGKFKVLTLSYDDGTIHDEKLVEILNKYGIKTTLNINRPAETGSETHVSAEKLKEFISQGHEVAVHGYKHIAPGMVNAVAGITDVLDCRRCLEESLGMIIRGMAYPDCGINIMVNGASYDKIKGYLSDLGIAYARTLGDDNNRFDMPRDWHNWMPTAGHGNTNLMKWLEEFKNYELPFYEPARVPKLFYMWGHSSSFNSDGNWDLLERFCQAAGGSEDIWYATNIEIYDYCQAYSRLEFSANMDTVYNPTLYDIWFEVDRKLYCIKSGETIKV